MSRSGLGNECEFPPGFDKPYQSPPQPHLSGSQSTFPHHLSQLPPQHLNYPPKIISQSNAPFSADAPLPSASTNIPKKRRGRPFGSRNKKPRMSTVYGMDISSLMFHRIMVNTEEDVLEKITTFSHNLLRNVTIISANGTISKVRFSQSLSSTETVTYEGRFEILSLKGSLFVDANESEQKTLGGIKGSFASLSSGYAFGGKIDGVLIAATPVQIILGSFFPEGREVVLFGPNDPPTKDPSNPLPVVHPSVGIMIS